MSPVWAVLRASLWAQPGIAGTKHSSRAREGQPSCVPRTRCPDMAQNHSGYCGHKGAVWIGMIGHGDRTGERSEGAAT